MAVVYRYFRCFASRKGATHFYFIPKADTEDRIVFPVNLKYSVVDMEEVNSVCFQRSKNLAYDSNYPGWKMGIVHWLFLADGVVHVHSSTCYTVHYAQKGGYFQYPCCGDP